MVLFLIPLEIFLFRKFTAKNLKNTKIYFGR